MVDKSINLPNDETQNCLFFRLQWLKRLDTQRNEPTNQNLINVPKVLMPTNKKNINFQLTRM